MANGKSRLSRPSAKALAAWLLAVYLNDVIKTLELAYTVFASGMIVPIIAGFFKDRLKVNERGALASMIGGGGLSLLIKLGVIDPPLGIDPILIGITANSLTQNQAVILDFILTSI